MQLTSHTDYALRVLIYLAKNPEQKVTIGELAEFFKISRNHLVKVVHNLSVKGFIRSIRGKGGGLYLAKPAEQINIGDVVRQMEGHFHIVDCFNSTKAGLCRLHPHCGLTAVLTNALEQFLLVLDATRLSDILPKT
jgi:Rrf2 family nitric oxide-sensitive transcriptional repressor